ncbi:MAG TPA: magnesium/cobalt transporter CorA [Solirubrobacteraceae bacterium]|nr:magnesium/cobalt transporter CorA [Solirubrobacteraceae bacterium]
MQVLDRIDRAQIDALRERGEFFWLDLVGAGEEELAELQRVFELHPLVMEDMHERGQRPKLDDYEGYVLLVFYGAGRDGDEVRLVEVECVISGDWIITHRDETCRELDELREALGRRAPHEQFVVYRILDTLTDTFFPVLASIDDDIDTIENDVIAQPTDAQLQQIFSLKRLLVAMRKVITPQRDLFARAGEDIIQLPGLEPSARDYFRDVYDHLIRISDLIDSYRDLLTGAMDVYLSTVSNRLNAVMKQLTIVATIFLPLSVVTGFFGQNFGWLVRNITSFWAFAVFGIGGLVLSVVALMIWFRRSGFLSN